MNPAATLMALAATVGAFLTASTVAQIAAQALTGLPY